MKKTTRIAALLAAAALIFGSLFFSCSDGDDDDDDNSSVEQPGGSSGMENPGGNGNTENPPVSKCTIKMNGTTFGTIAEALAACTGSGDYVIEISPGTYNELLTYNGAGKVLLKGTGVEKYGTDVVISERNSGNLKLNNDQRSIFFYNGSGSLSFANLTIQNTVKRTEEDNTGIDTQAECLQAKGSGNVAAYNCSFLSHQDTIQTVAKAWFYDCYIAGDVDFIWMESGSKVALYENCTLVAVGDETEKAYIAAPKCNAATNVWKGLVVYNSTLKAECKETTLCRNPWGNGGASTSMYNQVAYVNTTLDSAGTGEIAGFTLSGKNAFYKEGTAQTVIGWKIDESSKTALGVETDNVLTADDVSKEFAGRNNILNRCYDTGKEKYVKDSGSFWDVNGLATANGWSVDADTSKDTLDGETEITETIYNFADSSVSFTAGTAGKTNDGVIEWDENWKFHGSTYGIQGNAANAAIKIKVNGNSVIGFGGYENANGTFKVTAGDTEIKSNISAKTQKGEISSYFIYKGEAATLTLTVASNYSGVYFAKISVKNWDGEEEKATAISISGDSEVAMGSTIELKANVTTTYNGTTEVTWTSSNPSIASVDDKGVVTPVASGKVTITATSKLTTAVSDQKEIEVLSQPQTTQTALFDFKTDSTSVTYWTDSECSTSAGSGIQKKTGFIKGSASKVICKVDAGSGKLATTTGGDPNRAQFNKGTKILVPVSEGSVVSVMARSDSNVYQCITVGSLTMTNHTVTCSASSAGYIEIAVPQEANKDAYLFAIKVTNVSVEEGKAIGGEGNFATAITISSFASSTDSQDVTAL